MSDINDKIKILKDHVKSYPDFPKEGILFWDIFSVLQKPDIFKILKEVLVQTVRDIQPPVECVAALDARGFLFGPIISLELNIPFIPIRKKGKLPGCVISHSYSLEYGQDTLEIQSDNPAKCKRVLIVDDLLATGGSLQGACELVKKIGGQLAACLVIIELENLEGRKKIPTDVISLIKY